LYLFGQLAWTLLFGEVYQWRGHVCDATLMQSLNTGINLVGVKSEHLGAFNELVALTPPLLQLLRPAPQERHHLRGERGRIGVNFFVHLCVTVHIKQFNELIVNLLVNY